MDETAHLRLTGHAETFMITEVAHAQLLTYLANARAALSNEPDGDETIRDLEAAIGDRLRDAAVPVDDSAMTRILAEFGNVTGTDTANRAAAKPRGRFWCRIKEGSWFGGICLGIAARGHFDPGWTRTVVFFLLLLTGGLIGVVYLVLLLVLPMVPTVAEYERLTKLPKQST
jgi:phage shock protein PspC (stress-responsive transcriptional regulator)